MNEPNAEKWHVHEDLARYVSDANGHAVCHCVGWNGRADAIRIARLPDVERQRDALLAACELVARVVGRSDYNFPDVMPVVVEAIAACKEARA